MGSYRTKSAEDTARLGGAMARWLKPGDTVYLMGELGSGKSVLARGIARALGVDGAMASPTFTLMQPYPGGDVPVYHYDLYRLSDLDEVYAAGLDEDIGGDGVALVEWPVAGLDASPRIEARFGRGAAEDERFIALDFYGMAAREDAFADALREWAAADFGEMESDS